MYIDTHCHLYLKDFDEDRTEVVQGAVDRGVKRMYLPNIDLGSVQPMLDLSEGFPDHCFPMMGLHPGSVDLNYKEVLTEIRVWFGKRKFHAVGETGIDLYWDKTKYREQVRSFENHIAWAKELSLPLVIHARESFREIFDCLDPKMDDELSGVFHAFSGTREEIDTILSYPGFYFGIGGILTFRNAGLAEIAMHIPLERIVLETDSPYLAPAPKRGKRNESSNIIHVVEKLAEVHKTDILEVARHTTENALKLFKQD